MKFCSLCGNSLSVFIPPDDNRERHVCEHCGHIHYQNPRIIVCSIPTWENKVLLCKRAIEPRMGLWTLPGGFMENGETTQDAAMRETSEEACASIVVHELYSLFNVAHIDQVHLFYRATLLGPDFAPGAESLEVALFSAEEVPWHELAFPAVASTLQQYFLDLPLQAFALRLADIVLDADNSRHIKAHNFRHNDRPLS